MSSFEAQFVDGHFAELVQRVTSVMAIADELKNKKMIHNEKYSEIRDEPYLFKELGGGEAMDYIDGHQNNQLQLN